MADPASLATLSECLPGDILFFAQAKRTFDLFDTAIVQWTGSPIVHVAIANSAAMMTQAIAGGVVSSPINMRSVAARWSFRDNATMFQDQYVKALMWLNGQIGQPYGWGDVFNSVLGRFIHGLTIEYEDHHDCSGLALDFLQRTGGVPVVEKLDNHAVTPADMVQYLKVQL